MNKHKFLLFTFLLLCTISKNTTAQRYLGIATGDYNAINSMFLNPANISGSHEKVEISVLSVNAGVDNNLGTLTQLSNVGNSNAFNVSGNNTFSMIAPSLDVRLPSIMISLNDKMKQSFAFSIRTRVMNQFNHFDPQPLYNSNQL